MKHNLEGAGKGDSPRGSQKKYEEGYEKIKWKNNILDMKPRKWCNPCSYRDEGYHRCGRKDGR